MDFCLERLSEKILQEYCSFVIQNVFASFLYPVMYSVFIQKRFVVVFCSESVGVLSECGQDIVGCGKDDKGRCEG